ncbi:MAG: YesL family protein [Lachnospiraceae bacterium]
MNSFFNYDGPFFTVLNRISDLIILNLLYVLCCIPIVTIGAATTALYYVTIKMSQNEDAYIARSFFKAFRQNFRQSTIIWLIMLLFGAVVAVDLYCVFYVDFGFNDFALPIVFLLTLIYLMLLVFLFPLQCKFENKIKYTFKNALILSLRHLPFTVLFIACLVGEILLFWFFFAVMLPIYLLFGLAATAFGLSFLYMHIFRQYIREEDKTPDNSPDNEWHIPEEYDDDARLAETAGDAPDQLSE